MKRIDSVGEEYEEICIVSLAYDQVKKQELWVQSLDPILKSM